MGVENGMFRSEIGSGFEDPGGTPPPRIPRSTPPGAKRTVTDLFFWLKYLMYSDQSTFYSICIFILSVSFFIMYCILLKDYSLLRILHFPGYFETPLFRTFFHFPWDFEIAGFDCNLACINQKGFKHRCLLVCRPGCNWHPRYENTSLGNKHKTQFAANTIPWHNSQAHK